MFNSLEKIFYSLLALLYALSDSNGIYNVYPFKDMITDDPISAVRDTQYGAKKVGSLCVHECTKTKQNKTNIDHWCFVVYHHFIF